MLRLFASSVADLLVDIAATWVHLALVDELVGFMHSRLQHRLGRHLKLVVLVVID